MFEDTLAYGDTSYLFNGLAPLTQYDFQVRVLCSDGRLGCYPVSRVYTTLMDNCIDYSDPYNSPQVKYTFGSYSNPTQYTGRQIGRHTVMTITTVRETKVNSSENSNSWLLKVINMSISLPCKTSEVLTS